MDSPQCSGTLGIAPSLLLAPSLPAWACPRMVLAAIDARFLGAAPPHGRRTMVVLPSLDGVPRAVTNELEGPGGRYIVMVALQANGQLPECQVAYQLAHEIAHFWLDAIAPARAAIEVICEAIALCTLTSVGHLWFESSHLPRNNASKFDAYRRRIEVLAASQMQQAAIVRGLVPFTVEGVTVGPAHIFAASVLALELEEMGGDWTMLLSLREFNRFDDEGGLDLKGWVESLESSQRPAAQNVTRVLEACL